MIESGRHRGTFNRIRKVTFTAVVIMFLFSLLFPESTTSFLTETKESAESIESRIEFTSAVKNVYRPRLKQKRELFRTQFSIKVYQPEHDRLHRLVKSSKRLFIMFGQLLH